MIENLREIGNVLYRVGDDGMLYPVRRVRPDTAPQGVPPKSPGLLDIGNGIPERLGLLNQMFNPVEAMGQSMQAGERLLSPGVGGWDRVAAAGNMLSGVAGVVAPAVAANRLGGPAANALAETMTGMSMRPGANALREFATDDSGALKLYHGSPHDFDRFSLDKIGTGEGAQAYGHGLYFAENEGVARGYRDALSNLDAPRAVWKRADGSEMDGFDVPGSVVLLRGNKMDVSNADLMDAAEKELARASGVRNEALRAAQMRKAQESVDWLKANKGVSLSSNPERGRLYEVNVNANPEDFLDWDAPLSAQPQRVRDALTSIKMRENQTPDGPGPVGADLRRMYNNPRYTPTSWAAETPSDVTRTIKDAGIPGIRYLDAGSRGAGDGSRNYVVFDDSLIEIIRKYGIAGAIGMLGLSQAGTAEAQQPQGLIGGYQ